MDLDTLRRSVLRRLEADRRAGLTHFPKGEAFALSAVADEGTASPGGAAPVGDGEAGGTNERAAAAGQFAAGMTRDLAAASAPAPSAPAPAAALFAGGGSAGNAERSAQPTEERAAALTVIERTVSGCPRCPELVATRTQTVFGAGNPHAAILFLGEAPGADEDATGEPFVGRAGKLLNDIIRACRLERDEIYICNVLKCRPPGNRNPSPTEAANCREYLDAQIRIVDPDYIVCWGSVPAKELLGTKLGIGKLRKQFFPFGRAKVACTYHPSYLLRNPAAKKEVWADMKWLFADMGVTL
ncbi:uracil-DNA glycosylase [Alienimonas californiensis]|uniref:Type-4 uracil-DNA glycosylase n=1 Tax=Alienimonas californiensis TaxID=2527989 RepID=A0A517P8P3_9PLAN|nr:uracil-DNA glycosylase [Alienimonas californiensis]QDT15749.1 Uracil DNA glycosylase superfamily protein [Alienimonas californiensis]